MAETVQSQSVIQTMIDRSIEARTNPTTRQSRPLMYKDNRLKKLCRSTRIMVGDTSEGYNFSTVDHIILDFLRNGGRTQAYMVASTPYSRQKFREQFKVLTTLNLITNLHENTGLYVLLNDPRDESEHGEELSNHPEALCRESKIIAPGLAFDELKEIDDQANGTENGGDH